MAFLCGANAQTGLRVLPVSGHLNVVQDRENHYEVTLRWVGPVHRGCGDWVDFLAPALEGSVGCGRAGQKTWRVDEPLHRWDDARVRAEEMNESGCQM